MFLTVGLLRCNSSFVQHVMNSAKLNRFVYARIYKTIWRPVLINLIASTRFLSKHPSRCTARSNEKNISGKAVTLSIFSNFFQLLLALLVSGVCSYTWCPLCADCSFLVEPIRWLMPGRNGSSATEQLRLDSIRSIHWPELGLNVFRLRPEAFSSFFTRACHRVSSIWQKIFVAIKCFNYAAKIPHACLQAALTASTYFLHLQVIPLAATMSL